MSLDFDSNGVQSILKKYQYKLTDLCIAELIYTTPVGKEYIEKMIIGELGLFLS